MKKSNSATIKNNNLALIFDCIRNGVVSRAEIVKKTGLSKGTVTTLVNELISQGQLTEEGSEAMKTAGRPPVTINIVGNYRCIGGIALHRKELSVCLTDLKSNLLDQKTFPTERFSSPQTALDCLLEELLIMLKRNGFPKEKLVGIGVSCPGPVDYRNGIVYRPVKLELFHNFNLREYITEKLNLPVYLDNNSVLLAMKEHRLRRNEYTNYMFVIATHGIGSAIVSDGTIYRGSNGHTGELGHTSIDPNGISCACGNRGCLERYISIGALKEQFGFETLAAVAQGCSEGKPRDIEIINYISDRLSFALVNSVNLFDPQAVIMFGELNEAADVLFPKIEENIRRNCAVAQIHSIPVLASLIKEKDMLDSTTQAIQNAYFAQKL